MIWDYGGQIHAPDSRCRGKTDLQIVAYFFVLQNIYAHMQFFEKYIYAYPACTETYWNPKTPPTKVESETGGGITPQLNSHNYSIKAVKSNHKLF